MMLVLILSLVEDSSFNIIALIVEVKVQVVLGTSELEFCARFPTVHFDKRIVLKGKVFHLFQLLESFFVHQNLPHLDCLV